MRRIDGRVCCRATLSNQCVLTQFKNMTDIDAITKCFKYSRINKLPALLTFLTTPFLNISPQSANALAVGSIDLLPLPLSQRAKVLMPLIFTR